MPSSSNLWKLAGALAVAGALAALTAASALADPPNYPRHLSQAQVGLAQEPEIVGGLASPAATAQPARVPEIVSGIISPVAAAQPVSAVRPHAPGFNWGDAGIGAGSALGLMLLAGGMTLAVHRRQRHATADPSFRGA